MNELSLFTGAGGGLLGTKLLGWKAIGYVEWDNYCQEVLKARIADGHLDAAPIFGDIRDFLSGGYAEAYQGVADVVSAGFPCQPHSVAGKMLGASDPRDMWPQTRDVIRVVRPRFAFLENVPGILTGYIGRVTADLAEMGYVGRMGCLSASDSGAFQRRERVWIVAYSLRHEWGKPRSGESIGLGGEFKSVPWDRDWEVALREFRGMDDGMAYGVERTDAIRNGQVPSVVVRAWRELSV